MDLTSTYQQFDQLIDTGQFRQIARVFRRIPAICNSPKAVSFLLYNRLCFIKPDYLKKVREEYFNLYGYDLPKPKLDFKK